MRNKILGCLIVNDKLEEEEVLEFSFQAEVISKVLLEVQEAPLEVKQEEEIGMNKSNETRNKSNTQTICHASTEGLINIFAFI